MNKENIDGDAIRSFQFKLAQKGRASGLADLMLKILKRKSWKSFFCRDADATYSHKRWEDFVTTKPLAGLGEDFGVLKKLTKGNAELEEAWDAEVQGKPGGDKRSKKAREINVDIINVDRPTGTSRDRSLRVLREKAPELLQRVIDGELSPHRAMIFGGFRKEATPFVLGTRAVKRMSSEEKNKFFSWLKSEYGIG